MARAKNAPDVTTAKAVPADKVKEAAPAVAAPPAAATPQSSSPPARKPLGTKEVIPFRWRLVGTSHGVTLTLLKAVERGDIEIQYQRLLQDTYYTHLRILDVDEKVDQPPPPKQRKIGRQSGKETAKSTKKPKTKTATHKRKAAKAGTPPTRPRPKGTVGKRSPGTRKKR